jgi:integrase
MASLSPTTLTVDEQALILRATASSVRDHTIVSMALGTGLRLAEIVSLDVRDVYGPGPRARSSRRLLRRFDLLPRSVPAQLRCCRASRDQVRKVR